MAECNENTSCSTCGSASSCSVDEKQRHEQELLAIKLQTIDHRLAVMSGKGGVGKTTVAVNLAVTLAREGLQVGLMDVDIHGPNVPKMLGIESRRLEGSQEGGINPIEVFPNFKVISMAFLLQDKDTPVVWRGPLKHSLIQQFVKDVNWGRLDYLIIDLPPGTGDEPLSVAQVINKMDGSIIVTTPQDVALLDSRKSVTFSRQLQVPVIGIVENMSGLICPHCGKEIDLFKVGGGKKAALELGVPFLGSIPIDPEIVQDSDRGAPFVMSHPDSKAAHAFKEIVNNVRAFVEKSEESAVLQA